MQDMFSLAGKVALVTGASRGLGLAMAQALAGAGAEVVLNARGEDALRAGAATIVAAGGKAAFVPFDVADEAAASAAIAGVARRHGRLDILVNNAGTVSRRALVESTTDEWRRVLEVNLTALYVLAREAARAMLAQGTGRIINIGSILSQVGRATIPSYVASKHGVAGLTKALAAELGPKGVTVNAIAPGYFRTEINVELQRNPEFDRMVKGRTPLGRWGEAHELGGAVVFLASDAAAYVNGHVLVVDGGMTTTI
jgi:gluconate 5-dehydrogenase